MFRVWPDGTPEPSAWAWTGSDSAVQAPGQLYVSATRGSTATGTVSATLDDLEIR